MHEENSLSFSYVGYKQLTYKISDIIEKNISEFILDEELFSLDEVTIIAKKTKEKKLGTKSCVSFVVGDIRVDNNRNKNIQEFAKKLKIKKPSKLLDVNIALSNVTIESAKFRVNFYSIKHNLPFEKIGSTNIVIEKRITDGWNTFDLKKFDLKFEKPVFISIEYLPQAYNARAPFNYNGQLLGRAVGRSSSLGNWNVTKGAKFAMYVTVRQ